MCKSWSLGAKAGARDASSMTQSKPGDLILNRYLPNADAETRERAREILRRYLESQPIATEEAYAALLDANRTRYCGTLEEANAKLQAARAPATPQQQPAPPPMPEEPPAPLRPEPARHQPSPQSRDPIPVIIPRPAAPPRPGPEERELGKGGSPSTSFQPMCPTRLFLPKIGASGAGPSPWICARSCGLSSRTTSASA
jgi:hypothetical protein